MFDLAMHTTLPRELFKSFVGAFGYAGVKLPKWVYAVYLACMAFAVIGLTKGLWRKDKKDDAADPTAYGRVLLILIAIVALNYLVVLRINVQFDQPQGRYMFPALPAIVVALALGLERWSSVAASSCLGKPLDDRGVRSRQRGDSVAGRDARVLSASRGHDLAGGDAGSRRTGV